jgi:hypothetical protein
MATSSCWRGDSDVLGIIKDPEKEEKMVNSIKMALDRAGQDFAGDKALTMMCHASLKDNIIVFLLNYHARSL